MGVCPRRAVEVVTAVARRGGCVWQALSFRRGGAARVHPRMAGRGGGGSGGGVGGGGGDYRGHVTADTETLLLVARTGYRPHLTRRLLVVSIAAYTALTVAMLGKAAVATPRWRRAAPDGDVEDGAPGGRRPGRPRWWPWKTLTAARPAVEAGGPLSNDTSNGGGNGNGSGDGIGCGGGGGGDWALNGGWDIDGIVAVRACPRAHPRRTAPPVPPPPLLQPQRPLQLV